ncbi:MAG: hypothetical protein ACK45X_13660 [Roseiflexaceae bacterium]|jgi:hypothetical protein
MHFYLGVTDNQWFTALQRDQASGSLRAPIQHIAASEGIPALSDW